MPFTRVKSNSPSQSIRWHPRSFKSPASAPSESKVTVAFTTGAGALASSPPTSSILIDLNVPPSITPSDAEPKTLPSMERPGQQERKVSFNPEAIAFSPTAIAAKEAEDGTQTTGSAERLSTRAFEKSAVPRRTSSESRGGEHADAQPEDSPLGAIKKTRVAEANESSTTSGPDRLQLQDLLDNGIPMGLVENQGGKYSINCSLIQH